MTHTISTKITAGNNSKHNNSLCESMQTGLLLCRNLNEMNYILGASCYFSDKRQSNSVAEIALLQQRQISRNIVIVVQQDYQISIILRKQRQSLLFFNDFKGEIKDNGIHWYTLFLRIWSGYRCNTNLYVSTQPGPHSRSHLLFLRQSNNVAVIALLLKT